MRRTLLADFAPIGFAGYTPTLLVVGAGSPHRTLKDLQAAARASGNVSFASAGNGTSGHLAGELLKARLGGEMVHVPYKEGGLTLSDVMSGQVQPDELAAFGRTEIAKWSELVKRSGAQVD